MRIPELKEIIPHSRKRMRIMAFDPGETTGACFMNGMTLTSKQLSTPPKDFMNSLATIEQYIMDREPPDVIVIEDYRVYGWAKDEHAWNSLHTPKLIGGMHAIIRDMWGVWGAEVPVILRMASEAKQFVTDDKLKSWGLYADTKSQCHARDAVRHAIYQKIFG